MSEVVVVAIARAKEGSEEEVLRGLSEATAQTHAEEGCVRYAIHRAADDPARFVIVEHWRSRADLDEHLTKPYIQALAEQVALLAEPPQVYFLDPVPVGDEVKGRL